MRDLLEMGFLTCRGRAENIKGLGERFDHRVGMLAAAVALPRVREQRFLQPRAGLVGQDFHLRTERIGGMFG